MIISYFDITKSQADKLPVKPGQLIFCNDTGDIFLDTDAGVRKSMKDNVHFIATETARRNMLAPISNTIYAVLDSGKMYLYTGTDWTPLGSNNVVFLSNVILEPASWTGSGSSYTIAVEDAKIKYWHSAELAFDLSVADLAETHAISVSKVEAGKITLAATSKPTYPLFLDIVLS